MNGKQLELTGKKFGRWTVIERVGECGHGKLSKWHCKCECGNEKVVVGPSLVSGHSKSCGCLKKDLMIAHNKKHSGTGTRLYRIWKEMRARCSSPNIPAFPNYGGRGIKVCEEWEKDFSPFQKWSLEHGYEKNLTIDRINNDGNYEPNNCRWVNRISQNNNRRSNHFICYHGKQMTIAQLSRESKVPYHRLKDRIYAGWDIERAVCNSTKGDE